MAPFLMVKPPAMRMRWSKEGADYTEYFLAGAVRTQLVLHIVDQRADLANRLPDPFRVGFQCPRPIIECLRLAFDLRQVGWDVLARLLIHGVVTAIAASAFPGRFVERLLYRR